MPSRTLKLFNLFYIFSVFSGVFIKDVCKFCPSCLQVSEFADPPDVSKFLKIIFLSQCSYFEYDEGSDFDFTLNLPHYDFTLLIQSIIFI